MAKTEVKKEDLKKKALQKVQADENHITSKLTLGQRSADKLTRWAGSWAFIITFLVIIVLWMAANTAWLLFNKIWDPYPFILLNLVLSCLAAIQAPVILMSQNRAAERDRKRSEYDYAVNRKAAREIQAIDKQLDRLERKIDGLKKN